VLQLTVYYPRHSQKSMGSIVKKIYSLFLTNYTVVLLGSLLVLFIHCSYDIYFDLPLSCLFFPIYNNCKTDKAAILSDNKNKSGIYLFRNLKDKKIYVDSSANLRARFYQYFSVYYLTKSSMYICRALKKYGHSNFSLEILEYCDKQIILLREKHYIDLLSPEYNLCKEPSSTIGYKHSKEAKAKISTAAFNQKSCIK
jgi:hypothetical protein